MLNDFDPHNAPGELLPYERYKLYNWVHDIKPNVILEIGTGGGGSTYSMAEAIKKLDISSILFTCDPSDGLSLDFKKDYSFVKYHQMKSEEFIPMMIDENYDIDFIFFDGPDDPDIALEDILMLETHIKNGTYFAMHDWEFTKRSYDDQTTTKAQKIRPYMENSEKWGKVEVLSGFKKNSDFTDVEFDSVGLSLYKFKKGKISLAITTFERSDWVLRSFERVLKNDNIDEIIIVDDCTEIGTFIKLWEILDLRVNRKVRLYRNPYNLGPMRNKQEVVKSCKNEWVILLDSDNVIDNTYVDVVIKLNKNQNVIYCPGLTFRLDGTKMWDWSEFNYLIDKSKAKRNTTNALFITLLNTGNYFVNRKEYLSVFNDNVIDVNLCFNDALYYSYLWLLSGNKMKVVPEMTYVHSQHGGGIGGSWFANNTAACYSVTNDIKRKIRKW